MMTMIIMIMSMTQNARIVDIMKEQTTAKCPVITNAEVSMEATIMMETFQVTVSWVITLIIQDSTPFMQTYTSKPTIDYHLFLYQSNDYIYFILPVRYHFVSLL